MTLAIPQPHAEYVTALVMIRHHGNMLFPTKEPEHAFLGPGAYRCNCGNLVVSAATMASLFACGHLRRHKLFPECAMLTDRAVGDLNLHVAAARRRCQTTRNREAEKFQA